MRKQEWALVTWCRRFLSWIYDKDAMRYITVISYFYIGNIILMWHKFKVIIELMMQECWGEMHMVFLKTNLGKTEYNK